MIVEGKNIYMEHGEDAWLEFEFTDSDGNVAFIENALLQIYTVESKEVVYTVETLMAGKSLEIDVSGLETGVYWYQIDAITSLGVGRIGPARLYVAEGK